MSNFLKQANSGKTAGEIRAQSLNPEGSYRGHIAYIKENMETEKLLFGIDTDKVGLDGKTIRLFLQYNIADIIDKDTHREILEATELFGAVKLNQHQVNFVLFLNEIGCLKSDGAARFSPKKFFGRPLSLNVKHTTSEEGKTYSNTNLNLYRADPDSAPAPSYDMSAPDFGGEKIVACYVSVKPIIPHILKLQKESSLVTVDPGAFDLTVRSFSDKGAYVTCTFTAKNPNVTANMSVRFRLNNEAELDTIMQINELQKLRAGQSPESEADFKGLQFSAIVGTFEYNAREYNTIEKILEVSPYKTDEAQEVLDVFAENKVPAGN